MSYSVVVDNISKAYYPKRSRGEILKSWFLPFVKADKKPKWAVKNISFKVQKGESVGIVGMNGAGKSTLLKIITGVTAPTAGSVHYNGRVVALLELGMGLHQEFSGRDNIMFAGQLIGISPDELRHLHDEIISFSELGDFIDEPVRTYSSGMQMRLAFSIATAVRPDVLIVDEALSVGDTYFQQKSFARIRRFKEQGTTLLFVSHDKTAVLTLCDRAVLLNKGEIVLNDEPSVVMDYYNSLIAQRQEALHDIEQINRQDRIKTVSGNRDVFFHKIFLANNDNEPIEYVKVGERIKIIADIESKIDTDDLVFGILIKERTGVDVYGINTFLCGESLSMGKGEQKRLEAVFDANIGPGIYSVSVALHTGRNHLQDNFHWIDLAITFSVVNVGKNDFIGVTYLEPSFSFYGK